MYKSERGLGFIEGLIFLAVGAFVCLVIYVSVLGTIADTRKNNRCNEVCGSYKVLKCLDDQVVCFTEQYGSFKAVKTK